MTHMLLANEGLTQLHANIDRHGLRVYHTFQNAAAEMEISGPVVDDYTAMIPLVSQNQWDMGKG